jgi:hypothetical protein
MYTCVCVSYNLRLSSFFSRSNLLPVNLLTLSPMYDSTGEEESADPSLDYGIE